MTINVHEIDEERFVQEGYVEVGRWKYNEVEQPFTRIDFAHPETTCLHRMRQWCLVFKNGDTRTNHGYCLLDKNHKGRHSTVVFWCDACGKARRGEGHPDYDTDVTVCWFCRNVGWIPKPKPVPRFDDFKKFCADNDIELYPWQYDLVKQIFLGREPIFAQHPSAGRAQVLELLHRFYGGTS